MYVGSWTHFPGWLSVRRKQENKPKTTKLSSGWFPLKMWLTTNAPHVAGFSNTQKIDDY